MPAGGARMRVSPQHGSDVVTSIRRHLTHAAIAGTLTITPLPAFAAQCGGSFSGFLDAFGREASAQKISQRTLQSAFAGLTRKETDPLPDILLG